MPKTEIHFLGVLANTDNTVLKLKLQHGFEFEALPKNDIVNLIASIDNRAWFESFKNLSFSGCVPPNGQGDLCFVVKNSFFGNIEVDAQGRPKAEVWWQSVCDFQNKFVEGYLKPVLKLMRLFKEGCICMPIARYFFYEGEAQRLLLGTGIDHCAQREPLFTLEESEFAELTNFLEVVKLPFTHDYLQLCHNQFDVSYQVGDNALAFLQLMIGLETALNRGQTELSYRVSRNAAVLLGKDKSEAEKIFVDMKKDL